MHEHLRRVSAVGVAGLVGLSLAVFDPMAGPAAASVADIGPLSVPASALPTGGTAAARAAAAWSMSEAGLVASGEQAVAAGVANPGWQLAGRVGAGATKVVGAVSAPFTVGATGFFIGFEGTNSVMRAMGVTDVGIGALFPPHADPTYVANPDLGQPIPDGWTAMPTVGVKWQYCGSIGTGGCSGSFTTNSAGTFRIETTAHAGTAGPVNVGITTIPAPIWITSQQNWDWLVNGAAGGISPVVGSGKPALPALKLGTIFLAPADFPVTSGTWAPSPVTLKQGTTTIATWYPIDDPLRPPAFNPNPGRQFETRWTCTSGPGGTLRSAVFTETDTSWPQYPAATCGAGSSVATMSVWEVPANGSTPAAVQVDSYTATTGQTAWAAKFPQCTQGQCQLELYRVDPTAPAGSAKVSCFASPSACVNWWQDAARADNYQCVYGGVAVAITECAAYAPTFNVKTGADVTTDLGPVPSSGIEPYADPSTGTPVPGSPGQPAQSTDAQPEGCPPAFSMSLGGIGYWVTKGVSCALSAAFVPEGGVDTGPIDDAFTGSPLHEIGTLFGGIGTAFGNMGAGQCGVIVDSTPPMFGGQHLRISTCDPPWDQVAPLRLLITAGFMIGAVVSGIKVLLGTLRITVHSEPTRLT